MFLLFCLASFLVCVSQYLVWYFFWGSVLENRQASTQIDSGISKAIRDTNNISILKKIFGNNRVESLLPLKKLALREIPLMFGQIMAIFSSRHVTTVLTRRTCLRTVPYISTKVINLGRIIRKFIMETNF